MRQRTGRPHRCGFWISSAAVDGVQAQRRRSRASTLIGERLIRMQSWGEGASLRQNRDRSGRLNGVRMTASRSRAMNALRLHISIVRDSAYGPLQTILRGGRTPDYCVQILHSVPQRLNDAIFRGKRLRR